MRTDSPELAPHPAHGGLRKWAPWVVLVGVAAAALFFGLRSHGSKPTIDAQVAHISSELKCPVCDGETVAESQSAPSVEIRTEIRQDLIAGESAPEIIAGFEKSYGPAILEKPAASGVGLLVWLLPLLAVLVAGVGLVFVLRRWRQGPDPADPVVAARPDPPAVVEEAAVLVEPPDAVGDEPSEPAAPDSSLPRRRLTRTLVSCAGAVLIAGGVAWALVGSTGHRLPGQEVTGQALGTDQVNADLLAAQTDQQKNPPDAAGAVKEYQAVLDSVPNQIEALTGQGWLLAETGQPGLVQQGLTELQKAESVDHNYGPAHLYRGLALLGEDDYQDAVPELQWYLDHSPDPSLAPSVQKALAQAQTGARTQAPAG